MKNFEFKKNTFILSEKLENIGIDKENIEKFKVLIDKTRFVNIDPDLDSSVIHIEMIVSLFSKQENGEVFLQNILKTINHEWNQIDDFLISSTKEIVEENIDLDIGTNRRVDKIDCHFEDGINYCFTLSADLENHKDSANSNSYVEKEVFESPLAENNPWLQKYFGYSENQQSKHSYRIIAKEYLPGKNVAQYCNELDNGKELNTSFLKVANETGHAIGGLYKKMNGQLLEDLKLENIIYNDKNTNKKNPACRICDHSGFYEDNAENKSVFQILANLQDFVSLYYVKSIYLGRGEVANIERNNTAVSVLSSCLDSFVAEIGNDLLVKFVEQIKIIRNESESNRYFYVQDDLVDFTINYLEN